MTPLHAPTFSAPRNPTVAEAAVSPPQFAACGIPLDAEQFDNSTVHNTPERGRLVTLASFQLPPKYCGVLRFFSQFTDRHARDPGDITTPGLLWLLTVNGRPRHPYTRLEWIINPWGYGSFRMCIRLDENARVELAIRNVSYNPAPTEAIRVVGGRIVGQYWYNARYGDVVRFSP